MAIFWKKQTTEENQEVRRCLNCGKDISNKRKDAKFCCNLCWQGYHSETTFVPAGPPTLLSKYFWLKEKEKNNEQDDR